MTTDLTPTITDDEVSALPLTDARADLLRELLTDTGAAAQPPPRTRRWLAPVVAAAAVLAIAVPAGLSQLGGGDGDNAVDPGTPSTPTGTSFQIRAVDASSIDEGIDDAQQAQLDGFRCPARPAAAPADETQVACDDQGVKYLLAPAAVDGGVVSAEATIPQSQVSWVVMLQLDDTATAALADLSNELVGTETQAALLVDGEVLTAPTFEGVIATGQLQISGRFTQADAVALADRLAG